MYQYFSKWRKQWIDFTPTKGQLIQMKLYFYQIKKNETNQRQLTYTDRISKAKVS